MTTLCDVSRHFGSLEVKFNTLITNLLVNINSLSYFLIDIFKNNNLSVLKDNILSNADFLVRLNQVNRLSSVICLNQVNRLNSVICNVNLLQ